MYQKTITKSFLIILLTTHSAFAAPTTFFDTIPDGRSTFETLVTGYGGTYNTLALSGLASGVNSWDMGAFTITATNGNNRNANTSVLSTATLTGAVGSATNGGDAISMNADGTTGSGLTFTFDNPINGFAIDLEDWATCCYPSSINLTFDGGAQIQVGNATQQTDNKGSAVGHGDTTFVGAIDDTSTFTTVTFYGLGSGDALYAGGIIYYAVVPIGAISGSYVTTAAPTATSKLAQYFDTVDGSGEFAALATTLNSASKAQVVRVMKEIFPVDQSVNAQTSINAARATTGAVFSKVGSVLGNVGSKGKSLTNNLSSSTYQDVYTGYTGGFDEMVYALSQTEYKKFTAGENSFWIEGLSGHTNGDASEGQHGYDTLSGGVVAGFERSFNENMLLGFNTSLYKANTSFDNDSGKNLSTIVNFGAYGQRIIDLTKVTAMFNFGVGDYENKRNISSGGPKIAKGNYNSHSYQLALGASRLYTLDSGMEIEPFALSSYTNIKTSSYVETGAGSFNTEVSGDSLSSFDVTTGVTFNLKDYIKNDAYEFKAKPYVGYTFELEEAGNSVSFAGQGSSVNINGRSQQTMSAGLDLDFKYHLDEKNQIKFGTGIAKDRYEERFNLYIGFGKIF